MKIVFLQCHFPLGAFGGAAMSTYELARGMKDAGNEVFVITTCRKSEEAGEIEYKGIRVYRIMNNYNPRWRAYVSLYNPPVVREVDRLLKRIKPDIVHINNVHQYLSYHCFKLAKKHAGAVVFTARDVMAFNFGKLVTKKYLENFDAHVTWLDGVRQAGRRWNPFRNFLIKRYMAYADKLFTVSNALKTALAQNGIGNVEVIHTGINVNSWNVSENDVLEFKKRFNLENKKIILFGGRLSPAKGSKQVLEAMSQVVRLTDAILLVASEVDGSVEQIKKEAAGLNIEKKLVFTGWLDIEKVKVAYKASDVVLMPSTCFDSFPRIVVEAMAAGRPVVGTCYGGTAEIVVDGVTGYVVNPFHVNEMAQKIVDLLKDTTKAERFGRAGYERVKTRFSLDKMITSYVNEYENLLKSK